MRRYPLCQILRKALREEATRSLLNSCSYNSSAAEVQSQLHVALDQEYINKDDFDKVYEQAEVVSRMDSGFIKYLRSQLNKPK